MQALGITLLVLGVGFLAVISTASYILGLVRIHEREVGIVIKKFARKNLSPGQLIALTGEAGYQADTLAPGWHFGYFGWQYNILKVPMIEVAQGEIAVLVSAAGAPIPSERILAKVVACDDFQDARAFLINGGEKGRQIGILTAGMYRINTALFTVITADNCEEQGMMPEQLQVYRVTPDRVGIVTTLDGRPIDEGEIAGRADPGARQFPERAEVHRRRRPSRVAGAGATQRLVEFESLVRHRRASPDD